MTIREQMAAAHDLYQNRHKYKEARDIVGKVMDSLEPINPVPSDIEYQIFRIYRVLDDCLDEIIPPDYVERYFQELFDMMEAAGLT